MVLSRLSEQVLFDTALTDTLLLEIRRHPISAKEKQVDYECVGERTGYVLFNITEFEIRPNACQRILHCFPGKK